MRAGYQVRAPRESDLPGIAAMAGAAARADDPDAVTGGTAAFRRVWQRLDPAADAWVVTGPDDTVVGYADVVGAPEQGPLRVEAYTRPGPHGAGVGALLLARAEARAAERAAATGRAATLVVHAAHRGPTDRMLRARGFRLTRLHQRMRMTLAGPLVAPVTPDGIALRASDGGAADLQRITACLAEVFAAEEDGASTRGDRWTEDAPAGAAEPSMTLVAERADRVVGVCRGRFSVSDGRTTGEILRWGVRPEARRLGVGRALLLGAFALFAEGGAESVVLEVERPSTAGAHLLYEGSGMRTTAEVGRFERVLVPGRGPGAG